MLAQRALSGPGVSAALRPELYFSHRAAVGRTPEMLVADDLEVVWLNAAALALAAPSGPITLKSGRLILPQRGQEEALRAFLAGVRDDPGVWVLQAPEGRWLIRAEPIAPVDAPAAWLLVWRPMHGAGRYLWANLGEGLGLTPSETRMLRALLDGQSVDEAAKGASITVQTARTHVRRIYLKLGVNNREQLFAAALPYRWG